MLASSQNFSAKLIIYLDIGKNSLRRVKKYVFKVSGFIKRTAEV